MSRWWRPELWLVVAIPAAALFGGLLTLRLVEGDLSADGESAGVRRTAQVQTAELDPDLEAARARLSAQLQVDRANGLVRVVLQRGVAVPAGLELEFVHALHADRDLHARLHLRGGEWVAKLAPDAGSRWRVVLVDPARAWRLVGTLPRGGTSLRMQPALSAP